MTRNHELVSAIEKTFRRTRGVIAGPFALAMLLPTGALAVDSAPKETFDTAGHVLPLPPIRHLDAIGWMDWKPSAPKFKIDTLLLPDSNQPGVFRLPSDYARGLPHVS
jgi:hypothetical protein